MRPCSSMHRRNLWISSQPSLPMVQSWAEAGWATRRAERITSVGGVHLTRPNRRDAGLETVRLIFLPSRRSYIVSTTARYDGASQLIRLASVSDSIRIMGLLYRRPQGNRGCREQMECPVLRAHNESALGFRRPTRRAERAEEGGGTAHAAAPATASPACGGTLLAMIRVDVRSHGATERVEGCWAEDCGRTEDRTPDMLPQPVNSNGES